MERMKSELSRTVSLKELEKQPQNLQIEATVQECVEIAKRLSINALHHFSGTISLSLPSEEEAMIYDALFDEPVIKGHGTLNAKLTQTCVVTLEPIEINIKSEFDGVFSNRDPADSISEDSDESMESLPDILGPIGEETLEIGHLFIEQLALEIDPFPRKEGVEFDGFSSGSGNSDASESESPFAVLEKLKDNL